MPLLTDYRNASLKFQIASRNYYLYLFLYFLVDPFKTNFVS